MKSLPLSILNQSANEKPFFGTYKGHMGETFTVRAKVRWDDTCHNGHNTFAITGDIIGSKGKDCGGGCVHEEIAKAIPELAPFIKWHLTSSDGPMHYEANTVSLAGNRDCWGLLKGEVRQIKNGRSGLPSWILVARHPVEGVRVTHKSIDSATCPDDPSPSFKYIPWNKIGEGKERELDSARSSAVWPEATDEELCLPPEELRVLLRKRLPALMVEFKKAVESLGFTY